MAKRLAITIAGAVSLGSYEAGVLYEVLDAIRQHNGSAETRPEERIEMDVLTGASAGGMTTVILAQKLLYSADQFHGPYDNPLYNCWVKSVSLEGLQNTQPDELALHSLFSSDLIVQISKNLLLERYKTSPPSPAIRHAAAAKKLRIGVALTNLDGVDYGYPVQPDGNFIYTRYQDQRTRQIDGPASDNAAFWEPLRQTAVASGAFPFAFRSQDVLRSASSEPEDYPPANREAWKSDLRTFTYSDGGILQNQPLGMAKNLVDEIDGHYDQQNRYYLFVSPNSKDAVADDAFHEANADYFHLTERLVRVILGQAEFQDWITAEQVNRKIDILDQRVAGLKQAILAGRIDVAALETTAHAILSLFFPDGVQKAPETSQTGSSNTETLADAQLRIASQYQKEAHELSAANFPQEAFCNAVLAFETAAGLGARDHMEIYGVTAKDSELAGAGFCAFLGFFDQSFRDHDYDVGRAHARAFLNNDALKQKGALGPLHLDPVPTPIRPIDPKLNGLKLKDVPAKDLQQFKSGTRKRVNQMLKELLGGAAVLLDPAVDAAVTLILDRLIAKS